MLISKHPNRIFNKLPLLKVLKTRACFDIFLIETNLCLRKIKLTPFVIKSNISKGTYYYEIDVQIKSKDKYVFFIDEKDCFLEKNGSR